MVRRTVYLLAASLAALGAVIILFWVALPDPAGFARANPRQTAVMRQRLEEARVARRALRLRQSWVPLERISPWLVQAVLVSEDARFYGHGAFDWAEVSAAAEDSLWRGRPLRGASTLSQQLAKNLWLGTERTPWRKVKEAVLAVKVERRLPKRRILALYLNVAEWGNGVFGAEAAARAHFGRSAADLTPAQAPLLAAMLPAPRRVDLDRPSRWLARRSHLVLDRMRQAGRLDREAHVVARIELERLLRGGPAGGGQQAESGETGGEEPPDEA